MVVENSVRRDPQSLKIAFQLTDRAEIVEVWFTGILPDLFREGPGIIARGVLTSRGLIEAEQVLAKHDETYMAPEIATSLKSPTDVSR